MDYGRLNRKELQALCKEHGIPANKTNAYMAEALNALLKAPKAPTESEQSLESIPDPAEVVKSRAKRSSRSKKGADMLEETEVEDLSSLMAKSAIAAESSDVRAMELADEDISEAIAEDIIHAPEEITYEFDVVAEPAKVPRKPRRQTSKPNTKSLSSLVDPTPPVAEPTMEVVLEVEKSSDSFCPAVPEPAAESRTYSRRQKVIEPELAATIPESVPTEIEPVIISPVAEEELVEETIPAPKAVTRKSKAKGKTTKKAKPASPASLPVLEDGLISAGVAPIIPDSPTLGLASEGSGIDEIPLRAVSLSPLPVEEFEFQPVPSSFVEIMTPGKPLAEVTNSRVRNARKVGKSSKAITSEAKVVNMKHDTLPNVDTELDVVFNPDSSAPLTTPVKQSDDKENSAKIMDLQTLSLRKLQREVRKGLSRRNDTRAAKV